MPLSQEQLSQIKSSFNKTENIQKSEFVGLDKVIANMSAKSATQNKGFIDRTKEALGERVGQIKQTFGETFRGEISPVESAIRTVGDVAGGIGDVIGAAVEPAVRPLIEDLAQTKLGGAALNKLSQGMEAWENWKGEGEANRRIAEVIEGLVNIGDIVGVAAGIKAGAKKLGKIGAEVAKDVRRITEPAVVAGKKVLPKVKDRMEDIGQYAITQVTGVPKDAIEMTLKNPEKLKAAKLSGLDRMTLAKKVEEAVNTRIDDLSGLGKEYEVLRQSGKTVTIPENTFQDFVKENFKVDIVNGKIKKKPGSLDLSKGDAAAIEEFLEIYGDVDRLTVDEFLAGRKELDRLAAFDQGKTTASKRAARQLRAEYDSFASQIEGLKELDAQYKPIIEQLNQLKKDYFKPDGELKDSAVNAIANIAGKGKDIRLQRLEELIPDIAEQAKILKALESIEDSTDLAVGRYVRGGAIGGGLATGNIPLILGALVATPENITSLLSLFAKAKKIAPTKINDIIGKMKKGLKLNKVEANTVADAIRYAAEKLGTGAAIGTIDQVQEVAEDVQD